MGANDGGASRALPLPACGGGIVISDKVGQHVLRLRRVSKLSGAVPIPSNNA